MKKIPACRPAGKIKNQKGLTLIETLVATAIFVLIALGLYQAFGSLSTLAQAAKLKAVATALANEELEIARSLPYADVGIKGGWPVGKLSYQQIKVSGGASWQLTDTVRSLDDPFDGTIGGTSNDLNPADYKLVTVTVDCQNCRANQTVTLTTQVAPKNLETSSGNGALFVQVLNASGQPVVGAKVKVTNVLATTTMVINDVTNTFGLLQLVDLPPGNFAYKVEVSKTGYSSARTYAPGEDGLTNPQNPNPTVLAGQLTETSLVIDELSNLKIETIDQYCEPVGPFTLHLQGTKARDTQGEVLAYDQDQTIPATGLLTLSNLDWDTYNFAPKDSTWALAGSFPLQSILLPPGALGEVKLLLAPLTSRQLLVSVKDGGTGLPLSGATVTLSSGGQTQALTTSRGFLLDSDWSGTSNETDGNIEVNDPVGELKLKKVLDTYSSSGYLISRIFDTGTASTTFYNLSWQPFDQATSTGENNVRFQLATSNDSATTTWQFFGPDGTTNTYYTTANTNINVRHSEQRYLRYKVYLATADNQFSPNLSQIAITYSSECLPFGQVFFSGLSATNYEVTIAKTAYQTYQGTVNLTGAWQILEVTLNPQ